MSYGKTFKHPIEIQRQIEAKDYYFENAVFDCKFELQRNSNNDIQIEQELCFTNCKFTKGIDLSRTFFHKGITFSGKENEVQNNSHFTKSVFVSPSTFDNVTFKGEVTFNNAKFDFVSFNDTIFEGNALFYDAKFKDKTEFKRTTFNDVFFERSIFELSRIENTKSEVFFDASIFNGNVNFNEVIFNYKANMVNCHFKNGATFANTKFKMLADFYGVVFNQAQQFYKTDFEGTTVFSGATFKENVMFVYSLFSGMLIMRNTTFKNGLDLSLANISGELNFFDLKLNNFSVVQNPNTKKEFETIIFDAKQITLKGKRETFRIIKHQFENQGNSIDATWYKQLELKAYLKEVWNNILKIDFPFEKKRFSELISLFLNLISNRYGTSWLLGIIFTSLISITLFIIAFHFSGIGSFNVNGQTTAFFFDFINPLHNLNYINNYVQDFNQKAESSWFYVVDFVARISISFGLYQTVQAFRRFGKN